MTEHTITLCLPHSLLEALNKAAMAQGLTLNEICLRLLN